MCYDCHKLQQSGWLYALWWSCGCELCGGAVVVSYVVDAVSVRQLLVAATVALFDRLVWFVRRKLVRQQRLYVREFNVLEAKSS